MGVRVAWSLLEDQRSLWAHFEAATESGYQTNSWLTGVCWGQALSSVGTAGRVNS